ncbi:MAG: M48 family peptidase [Chloroflexi bacterium CFX2]|nr:M48 family peptidase [Chloroflexi bacterium CFX2]
MNGTVSRLSQRGFFIRYEQRIFYFAGYNLIMPDESAAVQIDTFIRAKRRTIALIVERDGSLTVRAPKRATLRDIHNFIEEKKDWILRSREKLKAIDEIPKKNFADGERFPFLGQDYELRLVPPQRPRVNHFSALHGFFPRRVRVNSAKTRWGSCAADGTINFTWRLVMAPPEVIDYVVLHELAHLKIKNHSPRFWKLVESLCPDFKRLRKWLRENGEKLNL